MKRKLIFPLIAALLLTPWPVAYAYEDAMAVNTSVSLEAASPATAPQINALGNAIGGVTPGDLFYIDTFENAADTSYTLYLTNADELVHSYRYMTLNIGIYVQTGTDRWEKVNLGEGGTPRELYLTMAGGLVSFTLPGDARYKITIDGGCFYGYKTGDEESAALPEFYLTVG